MLKLTVGVILVDTSRICVGVRGIMDEATGVWVCGCTSPDVDTSAARSWDHHYWLSCTVTRLITVKQCYRCLHKYYETHSNVLPYKLRINRFLHIKVNNTNSLHNHTHEWRKHIFFIWQSRCKNMIRGDWMRMTEPIRSGVHNVE